MDELFEQFMIEGRELIAAATDDLLALEEDSSAAGRVDSAFRSVHTLKGSVAIFDLAPMGVALHAAEDLLGAVRAEVAPMTAPVAQSLLSCLDHCDRWMDAVQESGLLPLEAPREAMQIATGLLALTGTARGPAAGPAPTASWLRDFLDRHADKLENERNSGRPLVAVRYQPAADCFFAGDDPIAFVRDVPDLIVLDIRPIEPWPSLADFDPYRCNLLIELVSAASLADLQRLFRFVPDQVEIASIPARKTGADPNAAASEMQRTIRVDALHIDRLLDLVGELVVTKNGLAHLAERAEAGLDPRSLGAAIRAAQATTDRLVADMHRAVMDVRMVPLDRVFRRLTRMVRELSQRLDRRVSFVVHGEETRVDKAVADALFEPLLHIVRNAVDHGIESSAARERVGKDPQGRLELKARTFGDQILIEIIDDGAGIDPQKVRSVAVERGILTEQQARAAEDDAAAIQLIFTAGFSTVSEVTDVSGRGVGMDAVRSVIERLGGRISLASTVGAGTTVSLRLPATAALTTVLVIGAGQERFAVPLDMVVETVRIARDAILPVGLGQAFVLRNETLPLVNLHALLGRDCASEGPDVRILVVDAGQGRVGIAVDEFSERMDVMLRPMTGLLSRLPGVSGTTLLGDGSVLLILDLVELIG